MQALVERWKDIWEHIHRSPTKPLTQVIFPDERVSDSGERSRTLFRPYEHYFQVRINEMYLSYKRDWFSTYDPMVFVVSEFIYDKKQEAVPVVVGLKMMEQFGSRVPTGMLFSNTRVAGPHPYCGGRLTLSVILLRIQRDNYAGNLLRLIENAANILDFSSALHAYVRVAGVVLDGIEVLLGLGDTDAIIGMRREFDPDAGDVLEPKYFALIDIPSSDLDRGNLWVHQNQLVYGKNAASAKPFREADFVLFSINQAEERTDITMLPFFPLWERVAQEALVPKEDSWQSAKANMVTLFQTLMLSPDLTRDQAAALARYYKNEMKRLHDEAVDLSELGPNHEESTSWQSVRKQSLDVLSFE